MGSDIASLEERLRQLERQNRSLRAGLISLALFVGVGVLAAATQPPATDVVRTKRVVVVDAEGMERVVIGSDKDIVNKRETTFGLSLRDADGKRRGALVTKDVACTANLTLLTGKEVRRLEGWTGKDSGGQWVVFDDEGKKFKAMP